MATGSAVVDELTGLETWRNYTHGTVTVKRLDHRGELNKSEIVQSGDVLHISPQERRLNQEKYRAGEAYDPFLNGFFIPEHLLDGEPDTARLRENPNFMADTDIRRLVKGSLHAIEDRIAKVTNPLTLERVLAIAIDDDASIRRVQAIQTRIDQLKGVRSIGDDDVPPDDGPDRRRRSPGRDSERAERSGRSMP